MVMYKIDRRGEGGGSKNRILGQTRLSFSGFQAITRIQIFWVYIPGLPTNQSQVLIFKFYQTFFNCIIMPLSTF